MLASITSCSNSNDEFVTTPVGKEKISSKITAREGAEVERWEKPSDDPLALDGYVHVTENAIYIMGEKIEASDSEEAQMAKDIASSDQEGLTSKRAGRVFCSGQVNGHPVRLIIVSGDNQPDTYWLVVNMGGQFAYQMSDLSYFDCFLLVNGLGGHI